MNIPAPSLYTITIMDDNKGRRLFSLGLLLLFAQSYHYVPLASGQQGKQYKLTKPLIIKDLI